MTDPYFVDMAPTPVEPEDADTGQCQTCGGFSRVLYYVDSDLSAEHQLTVTVASEAVLLECPDCALSTLDRRTHAGDVRTPLDPDDPWSEWIWEPRATGGVR